MDYLVQSDGVTDVWWPITFNQDYVTSSNFKLLTTKMYNSKETTLVSFGYLIVYFFDNILVGLSDVLVNGSR